MRLQRTFSSWVLVGSLLSAPAILAGCSPSQMTSQGSETRTMPMGDPPMADHAMTMDLGPKDAEFDLRFLDGMILHHQGAIAMAEAVLQNSQRSEMKQLAEAVTVAQQGEIDQMQQWRQAWYPEAGTELVMYDAQMGHTMAMTPEMQTTMMMDGNLGTADAEFDLRFINAMIPHHEGALAMAEQVLEKSDRPELRQVAQKILDTQQAEINQMQQWRQTWYDK